MSPRHALVVFPGALGDFVCLVPALDEIRRRGFERISLVCKSDLAPLVAAAGIAEPVPIEGRAVSWMFLADPPHEAEDFYGGFDRMDSFSGSGVAEVERNVRRWKGRVHRFRPSAPIHLAAHFMAAVSGGVRAVDDLVAEIRLPVGEPLGHLPRPRLLVHPGSGGAGKRWSRSGFAEIAARHIHRGGGAAIVLGPAEAAEREYWTARGLEVIDGLDTLGLASTLASTDLYLGNDSGVSHLAAAVGARGVALFGPTDPDLWRPLSPRVLSLRLEPWTPRDEKPAESALERVERALAQLDKVGPQH